MARLDEPAPRAVHQAGRRPKLSDAIIAATALRHDLAIYEQDAGFDVVAAAHPGLRVQRV